jgi:uncharacterized tellurite resistance protein B-like protein
VSLASSFGLSYDLGMITSERHILHVADLLMGAVWADGEQREEELAEVARLLAASVPGKQLPASVAARLRSFRRETFDLPATAAALESGSASEKRHWLECVAAVRDADNEIDFLEDDFLRDTAVLLGMESATWADLTMEMEELPDDTDG